MARIEDLIQGAVLERDYRLAWFLVALTRLEFDCSHVKNLRRKLGPEGERIETVYGIVYKFSSR